MQPPLLKRLPRPVYVRAQTLEAGSHIASHRHAWVQFLYAPSGTLRVTLADGSVVVPPQHALWIPAGVEHDTMALAEVSFRSLYIDMATIGAAGSRYRVVEVTPLVRELIVAAALLPVEYDEQGRAGRLIATLLDELASLQETDVYLPMPGDPRLRRICEALLAEPADPRGIDDWAQEAGASKRTLARLFARETRMGFREWRQRLRLHRALERLSAGASVTTVAFEVGYNSASAFTVAFKQCFGKAPSEFFDRSA